MLASILRWRSMSQSRWMSFEHLLHSAQDTTVLCFAQSNDATSVLTVSNHMIFPMPQQQLAVELKQNWFCDSRRNMVYMPHISVFTVPRDRDSCNERH